MEEEAKGENVMSVELAIQRELAYRRKLASFRSRSNRYMEQLMPFQVPSLNPGETTRPRPMPSSISGSSVGLIPALSYQVQASSSNPGPLLTPNQFPCPNPGPRSMPVPSQGLVPCVSPSNSHPTQMPFLAPRQIPSPRSLARPSSRSLSSRSLVRPSLIPRPFLPGIKRKATTSNLQYRPPKQPQPSNNNFVTVDPLGNFFCKACQVPCSGPDCLKQHLKGHKHKAKMQCLQMSKREGRGKEGALHCELCQIWCTDGDALEMHLKGKSHQAKVQELEYGREGKELRPRCELCQIWCMNEDAFQQHLKGKNHITRLYAVGGIRVNR
ncbi:uncharacterized protein LOC131336265 [Rhododendron vialii]|uniref:uncharacterized protein LOC131336265 n=1 Tax=Rhododendron vialii TaxID=182163 RepID=UPI00265EF392|nr:uncharacterized protein LOC131336265 [Rhododendron vialii]